MSTKNTRGKHLAPEASRPVKRRAPSAFGRLSKKTLVLSLALILVAVLAVGGTIAYLTDKSDALENTFTVPTVKGTIVETVDSSAKNSVTVRNDSDIPVYVRAMVVGNTINDNGNITGPYDVSSHLSGSGWTNCGGYYYYNSVVAPGASTTELLSSPIPLVSGNVKYKVVVMSEVIQADGVTSNGNPAVTDAWGYIPST